QYSLGCVLYFCLAGQYPFPEGTAVEKMMAHQTKQPQSLAELRPDIPSELASVIERLMQKAPADRFASTAEGLAALQPFAGAAPAHGRQSFRTAPPSGPRSAPGMADAPRPQSKPANLPTPGLPEVPRPPSPIERKPATPRAPSQPDVSIAPFPHSSPIP